MSNYSNGRSRHERIALSKLPHGHQHVTTGKTVKGDMYYDITELKFKRIPDRDIGTRVKGFIVVARNVWL